MYSVPRNSSSNNNSARKDTEAAGSVSVNRRRPASAFLHSSRAGVNGGDVYGTPSVLRNPVTKGRLGSVYDRLQAAGGLTDKNSPPLLLHSDSTVTTTHTTSTTNTTGSTSTTTSTLTNSSSNTSNTQTNQHSFVTSTIVPTKPAASATAPTFPHQSNTAEPSSSVPMPPPDTSKPSYWLSQIELARKKAEISQLVEIHTKAMRTIDYKRYKSDPDLVAIWLSFISLQIQHNRANITTVRKFYQQMISLGIGLHDSTLYCQWAKYEWENSGSSQQALVIMHDARRNQAQPSRMLDEFESKLARKNSDCDAPDQNNKENNVQKEVSFKEKLRVTMGDNTAEMSVVVAASLNEPANSAPAPSNTEKEQPATSSSTASSVLSKKSALLVNNVAYIKLELLGRGGSSKVFKVLAPNGKIYALKKVGLRGLDHNTLSGYVNEIALLKRMDNCDRIIKLYDSEINRKAGYLHMLMECGEIDLAHVLQDQNREAIEISLNFVRVYWQQMLEAVHAIHEERVVHSDLKPANFLFVKGALKLIDFGIAKAIQNDTTNIHRDHQVGTVNYMSPEAILDTNSAMKDSGSEVERKQCMKLGRASDVWSLGCILYQMVYGKTPFSHLQVIAKLQKIIDPNYPIEYPVLPERMDNPYLIEVIQSCLQRDPKSRMTIPELLSHPFLRPDLVMRKLMEERSFPEPILVKIVSAALELDRANPGTSPAEIARKIKSMLHRISSTPAPAASFQTDE